jgi:hypothetical protein
LVAGLVNALLFLACHWSTNLRVLFTCHRACLTYISYKRVIYVIYVYVICFNYLSYTYVSLVCFNYYLMSPMFPLLLAFLFFSLLLFTV